MFLSAVYHTIKLMIQTVTEGDNMNPVHKSASSKT
uniref:Uncharacterized protein n=1 Tax=Anguilla anguilla TaxID=7936 RepID=A0A0E9RMI4_ANGAN